MNNLSIQEAESQHYLMRCLQHPNGEVKMIALNEIERNIDRLTKSNTVPVDANIVISLIACLLQNENVSRSATTCLIKVLSKSMDDQNIRAKLFECIDSSDLTKCRVFDVAVQIAKQSTEHLEKMECILDRLYVSLDTEDCLLQMSYLELFSDLSLANHGFLYLENKGILKKVTQMLAALNENPLKTLFLPGYIKFFGTIATVHPHKIINNFPQIILLVFRVITNLDKDMLPIALDTLGKWFNPFFFI